MSSNQHLTVNVKLRIDQELQLSLERLASLGDRTVAAEMRRALRKYVLESEADLEEATA